MVALLLPLRLSFAKRAPSKEWQELEALSKSAELTQEEKIAALKKWTKRDSSLWIMMLYRMKTLDAEEAQRVALQLFRRKDATRDVKYGLSRFLLRAQMRGRARKPDNPPGFISEYREFLVNAILSGGKKEFNKRRTGACTAVGEYAGIAGGIDPPTGVLFEDVSDKRTIPVLLQCLDAPDHIYAKDQGCVIMGKPGESTGRNTQRQGIPLALARLGAAEAIPRLKSIVDKHHDWYFRYNAAYALAGAEEQIVAIYGMMLGIIRNNNFTSLDSHIHRLGRESRSLKIKALSAEYLKSRMKPPKDGPMR
jgi:hypothetical protein